MGWRSTHVLLGSIAGLQATLRRDACTAWMLRIINPPAGSIASHGGSRTAAEIRPLRESP